MKFTVVGSLNYDLVTSVNLVPEGGETVKATNFETHYGGKGANQAYAIRRLTDPATTEVAIIGCIGDDSFGVDLLKHLKSNQIDVSQLNTVENERTGIATILVEKSGENRIMVYPGANSHVSPTITSPEKWENADYVVLQNEIPLETTFEVLRQAQSRNVNTVINPSPLPDVPLADWPYVDILVVNECEAAALANVKISSDDADVRESAGNALPVLLQSAGLVVITLGKNGVIWQEAGAKPGFVPAAKIDKLVDTTGAGDTFLAAFVSQMAHPEKTMEQRMEFAARAAGVAVTRNGAASSIPSLAELS